MPEMICWQPLKLDCPALADCLGIDCAGTIGSKFGTNKKKSENNCQRRYAAGRRDLFSAG
jgi:hypothetical protein